MKKLKTESAPTKFREQVLYLEEYLSKKWGVSPPETVTVWAFECDRAGGLRIAEINIGDGSSGCAYQRSDADPHVLALILACEDYVREFNVKPTRPRGWTTDLDPFADARWKLDKVIEASAVRA
jgi:hypothetical protein